MDFTSYFYEQQRLHPSMLPQDALKLCYQAAFGAEHLLSDISSAREYFDAEYLSVTENAYELSEWISPYFCRVNIGAWKKMRIPQSWLFEMFRITAASGGATNSREVFFCYTEMVGALAKEGETSFSYDEWRSYISDYGMDSPRPVHHSDFYRISESPAYRVISAELACSIPLLARISRMYSDCRVNVVAIDGRAASGKTTITKIIKNITGAGIVHMDDFFLPADLRTEERLSQPGGNFHYERFLPEVVKNISDKKPFDYRVFDCSEMRMVDTRRVCEAKLRIVEGAYSCHPILGDYMGLRVFCDVAPDEQLKRIRKRNGDKAACMFVSRWIPLEEAYIEAHSIRSKADIVVTLL